MESEDLALESLSSSAVTYQGGGRESVRTIVKEIINDLKMSKSSASGQDVSTLQRYRDVIVGKAPRLERSVKFLSADLVHWMNHGGQWRAFLILSTGSITLVSLTGLFVFLLFLITATANTVILALLGSVAAVGAVTAVFFTALAGIYIGVLTIATCVISTIGFFTIITVLIVTGCIAFWWVVWLGAKNCFQVARGSLAFTASTLQSVSASALQTVSAAGPTGGGVPILIIEKPVLEESPALGKGKDE